MARVGFREEVFNVVLAQLLEVRGVVSLPEGIELWAAHGLRMPDVLVEFRGLRTIIEGKIDDHTGAAKQVLADAQKRLDEGVAHIAIAALYPGALRRDSASLEDLRSALAIAQLKIAIVSEAGEQGWTECNVDGLGDLLRRTFDQLVREDVVAEAASSLQAGVEQFARSMAGSPAVTERWAEILGIRDPRPASAE